MNLKKQTLFLLFVVSVFLISGCGSKSFFKDENESPLKTADSFYKMLQWKYYDRATSFIHHDKVMAYDKFVTENEDNLNITSYEIKEFNQMDESLAEIKVAITYYRYPSVTEKSVTLWNRWEMINDAWFVNYEFVTSDFTKE